MTPVYLARNLGEAELFKQRLLNKGIEAVVRHQHLQGAIGELPANLLPEVCVVHDEDFEAARGQVALMEAAMKAPVGPEKRCGHCGEENPGSFELCWSCGSEL